MIGTVIDATGILAGGLAGILLRRQPATSTQLALKSLLGILTTIIGLRLTWLGLSGGGLWSGLQLLVVVMVAMILGRLAGRLMRIQRTMNRLGQYAKERFAAPVISSGSRPMGEGFVTCTILFCAAPLSILGAVQDGVDGRWGALAVKGVMDAFAALAFATVFRWATIIAIIPLVAFQGTISLVGKLVGIHLHELDLVNPLNAVGGLLVFCVALLIFEVRRVEVGDYLPSLVFAPLLAWVVK